MAKKTILKTVTPYPLSLQDLNKTGKAGFKSGDRLKGRHERLLRAADLIPKSVHKSAIIPYMVRGVLDYREGRKLTTLQEKLIKPIVEAGLDTNLVRRFTGLPDKTAKAFNQKYFREKHRSAVDEEFRSTITEAGNKVAEEIRKSGKPDYSISGGFTNAKLRTVDSKRSLADVFESLNNEEPDCPPIYQLRLEYRGITTRKISERLGGDGVDPYLITAFYRIPIETSRFPDVLHEVTAPMKVKHLPEDLDEMNSNQWSPSGGSQDSAGNPSNPIQFHPKFIRHVTTVQNTIYGPVTIDTAVPQATSIDLCPFLRGMDLHFALISVWEEDGDQSEQIMRQIGGLMTKVGQELMAIAPLVGGIVVVVGLLLELISFLLGSEDDYIGDFILLFDEEQLANEGYHIISHRIISDDDNDWTIYLGVESKKLTS